jgi:hypothetical protein
VPVGGAAENVSVRPLTEYVDGSCTTPDTATRADVVPAGATDIVNAVVELLPEKVSVTNAACDGSLPIYAIGYS